MKHFLVFAGLFLSIITTAVSQANYFADSTIWTMQSTCSGPSPCIVDEVYNYYLNGDSLISGNLYKKIAKKGSGTYAWFAPPPVPPGCQGNFTYNDPGIVVALLRQSGKEIRIWNANNSMDELLYDFDLSIGDTLPLTYNNFNSNIVVSSIDSMLVQGVYRNRFTLQNSSSQYLYEGVGHSKGLLENFPPIFDCAYLLACYSVSDTAYYPSSGTTCNISIGISEVSPNVDIKMYPNPVSSVLFIDLKAAEELKKVTILDVAGKRIFMQSDIENKIDVSDIPQGFYMIELLLRDNTLIRKKIIKN